MPAVSSNFFRSKVTVRTHTPEVTKFMSTGDEAWVAIISNSSNKTSNIFYLGSSNKEGYLGVDQHKIVTFRNDSINLRMPATIYGDLLAASNIYDIGSPDQKWRNLIISGCNLYFNDAIVAYDPNHNEIAFKYNTEFAQIIAKNISVYGEDGSRAILSSSEFGTILVSYDAETDLISSLNLAALDTNQIPEGASNLYFTWERARTVIEATSNVSVSPATNTTNELKQIAQDSEAIYTNLINNNTSNIITNIHDFADSVDTDLNIYYQTIIQGFDNTANTLNSIINDTLSTFTPRIMQINSITSNYIEQTSNQILANINSTSHALLSQLVTSDVYVSNIVYITSNDIIQATQQTSNSLVNIIRMTDSNILNTINVTSNSLTQFWIDTSNILATNIQQTIDIYLTAYVNSTSNILRQSIIHTSNQIANDISSNYLNVAYTINQTSNNLATSANQMRTDITNRITGLTLDDIQNGTTKKFVVNNIYDADLKVSNLTTYGHILPSKDGIFSIGSSSQRWHDLYLSGNTINLGSAKISTTANQGIEIRNTQNQLLDIVVSKVLIKDSVTNGYSVLQSINNTINITATSSSTSNASDGVVYTTTISEGSNMYFTWERAGAIAYASNLLVNAYTTRTSNELSSIINQLTTDKIANGTSNKFIVNGTYAGDLSVHGTLIASNLDIKGPTANIRTNEYITEMLKISTLATDGPALKVLQSIQSTCNIAEFYNDVNPLLIITNQGNIAIGKTTADESLDVVGNIKFGQKINEITATELSYLSGIATPVQSYIDQVNADNSNMTSNLYVTYTQIYASTSNTLTTTIMTLNDNILTYITQSSNTFSSNLNNTCNNILIYASSQNSDLQRCFNTLITSAIPGSINNVTSNINDRIYELQYNLYSYITNTCNTLVQNITDTSNTIRARINNIISTGWIPTTSNIIFLNKVSIGSNLFGSEALTVAGNIKFSDSINEVTSNEFNCLNGVTSPIQQQLTNTAQGLLDYTSNTSNAFIQLFNSTSNNIMQRQTTLTGYVTWTSNDFVTNVTSTSSNLNASINNFLASGFVPSQWSNVGNNVYYTLGNVGIGTINVGNNKLEVYGDVNIIGNSNLKKTLDDGITVVNYQLERWKDSLAYEDVNAVKYIYYNDGYVGIQQTAPATNLHVGAGSYNTGLLITCNFTSGSTSFSSNNTGLNNVCAIFDSALWCKSAVASASDIRIKKNIYDINDDSALEKIMAIEPKVYNYIDPLKGTDQVYGFLAQQVHEVLPEAVALRNEVVPNVFKVAACDNNVVSFVYDQSLIKVGVKLYIISLEGASDMYTVLEADGSSIKIDKNIPGDKVFVYGTEVSDFHTLDKTYIYTLNVCATQILSREIDAVIQQVEMLEQQLGITSNAYMDWLAGA
jgi:hypothetical protein